MRTTKYTKYTKGLFVYFVYFVVLIRLKTIFRFLARQVDDIRATVCLQAVLGREIAFDGD
jgi:hypothetical protein